MDSNFILQFEYTFLLYLNPDWTEDMYGETIFLNQIKDMIMTPNKTVIQEKEYEAIGKLKDCIVFRVLLLESVKGLLYKYPKHWKKEELAERGKVKTSIIQVS